ncbi:SpoIIE family protein phosphatase [Streptomyces nojiriensis]
MTWRHRFTRGDVLLLVTDGLVEARSPDGVVYPLVSRLGHHFADHPGPGPADVIDFLNTDLPRQARTLHDDVAMLAIAPQGSRLTHHRHIRRGLPSPTASLTH